MEKYLAVVRYNLQGSWSEYETGIMQYTKSKFLLEKHNRTIEGKKETHFASRNKKTVC